MNFPPATSQQQVSFSCSLLLHFQEAFAWPQRKVMITPVLSFRRPLLPWLSTTGVNDLSQTNIKVHLLVVPGRADFGRQGWRIKILFISIDSDASSVFVLSSW